MSKHTTTAEVESGIGGLDLQIQMYGQMALIRAFETRVSELYRKAELPGFIHTSIGQEAVAVGICSALGPDDYVVSTHRGHGHCLAKGADVNAAMAELFGKAAGMCSGKGGSMHIADPSLGILGANAIVGASMPIATGAALSGRILGRNCVAVAFFGDGAVNTGSFHEALNLATVWSLPVLFVCENNGYAEFSAAAATSKRESIGATAPAYGIAATEVDGNDAAAVLRTASGAVERCRAGEGPVLIDAHTYRWHGHYEGDAQVYKPDQEVADWKARDPLLVARTAIVALDAGAAGRLDELDLEAGERVAAAEEFSRAADLPDPSEALTDVYSD